MLPLPVAPRSFADRPLAAWLAEWEAFVPRPVAERVARAIWRGEGERLGELPQVTRALRDALASVPTRLELPPVRARSESADGATKLLLELAGGRTVETVLIPEARRTASRARMQEALAPRARRRIERRPVRASGCISTQVGCGVGCAFCASGLEGLVRNLDASEVLAQVVHLRAEAEARGLHLGTLVVMGMGEPFHNQEALFPALEHLTHPAGLRIGPNWVTVSTIGVAAGIERLLREGPRTNLAVSLHAPDDATRQAIVPLARRLPPVAELIELAAAYGREARREVSLGYVLLDGVNDDPARARELARLLAPHPRLHVNLIPWNPVEGMGFAASPRERVSAFFQALRDAGVPTHVRRQRGAEADAACGQLRMRTAWRGLSGCAWADRRGPARSASRSGSAPAGPGSAPGPAAGP